MNTKTATSAAAELREGVSIPTYKLFAAMQHSLRWAAIKFA